MTEARTSSAALAELDPEVYRRLKALDRGKLRLCFGLSALLSVLYVAIFLWAVLAPDNFGSRIGATSIGLGVTVITLFVGLCFATTLVYARYAGAGADEEEAIAGRAAERQVYQQLTRAVAPESRDPIS